MCLCVIYVHTWKQANLNTMWQFKRLIITQASLKTKIGKLAPTGYVTLIKTAMYWCKNRQSQNSKRIKSKNNREQSRKSDTLFPSEILFNNNTGTNSLCERPTSQLIDFYTAGKLKEGRKTPSPLHLLSSAQHDTIRRFPDLSFSLVREED